MLFVKVEAKGGGVGKTTLLSRIARHVMASGEIHVIGYLLRPIYQAAADGTTMIAGWDLYDPNRPEEALPFCRNWEFKEGLVCFDPEKHRSALANKTQQGNWYTDGDAYIQTLKRMREDIDKAHQDAYEQRLPRPRIILLVDAVGPLTIGFSKSKLPHMGFLKDFLDPIFENEEVDIALLAFDNSSRRGFDYTYIRSYGDPHRQCPHVSRSEMFAERYPSETHAWQLAQSIIQGVLSQALDEDGQRAALSAAPELANTQTS